MAARARVLARTEFGNPILERVAKRVTSAFIRTDECKELRRNMIATMRATGGVGLAAPQIGVPLAIAVIEVRSTPERPKEEPYELRTIINPRILAYTGKVSQKWEGCLSFNKIFGQVPRSERVTVEYQDEHGVKHTENASGLLAHIFQHEVDHLNGIRFTDRLTNPSALMTASEYRSRKKAKKR